MGSGCSKGAAVVAHAPVEAAKKVEQELREAVEDVKEAVTKATDKIVAKLKGADNVLDLTICHAHDPLVASVQSWFASIQSSMDSKAGKLAQISQSELDKLIKDFHGSVKQFNISTSFQGAQNTVEAHAATLKAKWADWKAQHEAGQKLELAADYAQLLIMAGLSKLSGNDEHTEITEQLLKFSEADPGWATTVFQRLVHPGDIKYRRHSALSDYVYPLQTKSGNRAKLTVALISDWGTATPQAFDILRKVGSHAPDVVLHLGDVYYSGTTDEQREAVLKPARECLPPGTQFWNLPGNHDYYAGGEGFLQVVDDLRAAGFCSQESSYFCLEGDSWVILAMDTALHDADPLATHTGASVPWIEDSEAEWHKDKIAKAKAAGKKVLLLSHHQYFTLCSTVGRVDNKDQALNHNLARQLGDSIKDLDAWFWGHEHSLQIFAPYGGLKRGRLIGNGSVPCLVEKQPYQPKDLAPGAVVGEAGLPVPQPDSVRMGTADFGFYHNNGYVILTLDGADCKADYYDVPWLSADVDAGCKWGAPKLIHTEAF